MTTMTSNPYLAPHAEAIDLTEPWRQQIAAGIVKVEAYRVKALTSQNLENLCRLIYRDVKHEAGKYEGSRLTEELAIDLTTEVVTTLEMLRLAMIALAEHRKEPTEPLRQLDLSGVTGYFKRHIGEAR